MSDVYFIYHVKDGEYWFLNDFDFIHKSVDWSRWCPHIFSHFEAADFIADKIRLAMPDYNIFVSNLDSLPMFIIHNRFSSDPDVSFDIFPEVQDGREFNSSN